jgi:hypothetical protein
MRRLNDQLIRHYHVLQAVVDSIGLGPECSLVTRLNRVADCSTVGIIRWNITELVNL